MTHALRRARAALVRQVGQRKDCMPPLVFPSIRLHNENPWTVPPLAQPLQELSQRIPSARVTLTLDGVPCTWATSCFPEQP